MLIKHCDELPDRIKLVLTKCECEKSDFVCGLKTDFKLSYEIPYMWIVVTRKSLVLCNTHTSRRGLWALYSYSELNSIRLVKDMAGYFSIEIFETNPNKLSTKLPLPHNTSAENANELFMCCKRLINRE